MPEEAQCASECVKACIGLLSVGNQSGYTLKLSWVVWSVNQEVETGDS